ncbi:rhodanese-like domain-containing protein [Ureibacillus sp. FSL K6-8385]|uniref:Rhodanese-like domain-containing protein n=1 Tax=Ureibacillus terrenus TaxID=118246 RepID=A0A540V5D3_9BACL|nr:rhodanese-like domain-containing protein [Ureibacillus terrenus]MED3661157.1 rhodanese-like domain-containing protein [Ureibacillus terrenus]MED3764366.1 rhodanese-like domain-containing protein [Ureibacillus terrenus]TQE91959.1 rhodanese-like domain-containing protein [Ureibacillus terrenus]
MEWIVLVVIVALFLVWRLKPAANVNTISASELKKMLNDKNKVFIDVRTPAEYKANHIPQFQNLPLGSDFSKLPKDKEIVVICQSGMRSGQACRQLKKLGYERVTNVRGGMNAWR